MESEIRSDLDRLKECLGKISEQKASARDH